MWQAARGPRDRRVQGPPLTGPGSWRAAWPGDVRAARVAQASMYSLWRALSRTRPLAILSKASGTALSLVRWSRQDSTVHRSRNPLFSLNHRANVLRSGLYPGRVFTRIAVPLRASPLPTHPGMSGEGDLVTRSGGPWSSWSGSCAQ